MTGRDHSIYTLDVLRLCSHGLAIRCRYGRICRLSAAGWTPLDMSLVVLVRQLYSVGLIDGYGVVLLDKSVKTGKIFPFLFFFLCVQQYRERLSVRLFS